MQYINYFFKFMILFRNNKQYSYGSILEISLIVFQIILNKLFLVYTRNIYIELKINYNFKYIQQFISRYLLCMKYFFVNFGTKECLFPFFLFLYIAIPLSPQSHQVRQYVRLARMLPSHLEKYSQRLITFLLLREPDFSWIARQFFSLFFRSH